VCTDWLAGSGLQVDDGLVCDEHARALLGDGTAARDVVVAGDVARWPHPWAGERGVVLGHWTHAVEQAEVAARTLLSQDRPAAYRPVPSFWSDVHGVRLRAVGLPALADAVDVHECDPDTGRLEVAYRRDGVLIAAVTGNRISRAAAYRARLADRLTCTAAPAS
jgi:hypothetical protein